MSHDLLLAGALPGGNAGNPVSSQTLLHALRELGDVTLLSHRLARPSWRESRIDGHGVIRLGVQPLVIHAEGFASGRLFKKRLQKWKLAWVVNSRYASSLHAAGVPYVIWEATTSRDELAVSTFEDVRRSARGSGAGFLVHRSLLPIGERLEGRLYKNAAAVCAMSEYTRRRMIQMHGLGPDAVRVLDHPPSPAFLTAVTRARAETRPRGKPPYHLLFVGRADDARKNFGLLPHVLRRVRAKGIDARLTVIGKHNDQWLRAQDLSGLAGVIRFLGVVSLDELVKAYLEHDLLLLPSRQEGFGIVVAEALAAGLPVVSTRCGGPEAILEASGAGELVAVDDAEMAASIVGLLGDDARLADLRKRALCYSAGPLSFEAFATEVRNITMSALARLA